MEELVERLKAVLFDVDFTLARPGPELMPEGYVTCGRQHGLELDFARYEQARAAALVDLKRHPELDHDEEIWIEFTERIVQGMGGEPPTSHDVAVELTSRWQRHENFELYDDVQPVLRQMRDDGLKIGLVSNSARDIQEFARHHSLAVDAGISSFHHGKTKPHASIFRAVLDLLEVEPGDAVMVGDTLEDDIEGALAIGMHAVLVDRIGTRPDYEPRIDDLYALAAALKRP
ncbi:MAG TPA: HAD family hydrolase [Gaiellaceae bacterium]|jgi:HAD superfamily hydrolase (TIGR01662 family)